MCDESSLCRLCCCLRDVGWPAHECLDRALQTVYGTRDEDEVELGELFGEPADMIVAGEATVCLNNEGGAV